MGALNKQVEAKLKQLKGKWCFATNNSSGDRLVIGVDQENKKIVTLSPRGIELTMSYRTLLFCHPYNQTLSYVRVNSRDLIINIFEKEIRLGSGV